MFQERSRRPTGNDQHIRQLAETMGISPDELVRRKQEVAKAVRSLQADPSRNGRGNGRQT